MYRLIAKNYLYNKEFITEHVTLPEAEKFAKEQADRRIWGLPERWIEEANVLTVERSRVKNKRIVDGITQCFLIADYDFAIEKIQDFTETIDYWETLRIHRTEQLYKTDWTQLADSPLDQNVKKLYREYRQYLRDLTKNYDDKTVKKYKIMSFVDWKTWKNY